MKRVAIVLMLSGSDVTLEEGEQFANFINFAVKAAGGSVDDRKITVENVTLLGEQQEVTSGGK